MCSVELWLYQVQVNPLELFPLGCDVLWSFILNFDIKSFLNHDK